MPKSTGGAKLAQKAKGVCALVELGFVCVDGGHAWNGPRSCILNFLEKSACGRHVGRPDVGGI